MVRTSKDYLKAIRAQYEIAKSSTYSSFLLDPSPAKLRDYCLLLLESQMSIADQSQMALFFKPKADETLQKCIFDYDTEKLKAVRGFLIGKTQQPNSFNLELIAILVDYQPRPLRKFLNSSTETQIEYLQKDWTQKDEKDFDPAEESDKVEEQKDSESFNYAVESEKSKKQDEENFDLAEESDKAEEQKDSESFNYAVESEKSKEQQDEENFDLAVGSKKSNKFETYKNSFVTGRNKPKSKNIMILLIAVSILSLSYVAKDTYFSKKECMQWQEDHYEMMDCEINGLATISPVLALDEDVVELKKVTLRRGMPFFKYNKPLYYYYKVNRDSVEFFNGPGLHPITQEPLRKITWHMIYKYVK